VATAAAELHRIGDDSAMGELSDMAAGYRLPHDDIQAGLIRGINRTLTAAWTIRCRHPSLPPGERGAP
jgi:hypothetical protein